MKNLIFVLLGITLLSSCSSSNGQKGKLRGNIVCTLDEYDPFSTKLITEYYDDGRIKRQLLSLMKKSFEEINYNYSGNELVSMELISGYVHDGTKTRMINPDEFEHQDTVLNTILGGPFKDSSPKYIPTKNDDKGNWIERRREEENKVYIQSRKIYYKGEDYQHLISEFESYKSSIMSSKSDNSSKYQRDNGYQQNTNDQKVTGQWIPCSHCNGTGREICSRCVGKGWVKCGTCMGDGVLDWKNPPETCYNCKGKGIVVCNDCNGKGNTG